MVIRLGMMQHTITGWLPPLYYVHSIRLDISCHLSFSSFTRLALPPEQFQQLSVPAVA